MVGLMALLGCGADNEQAKLCAAAIGAFVDEPERLVVVGTEVASGRKHGVTVRWRLPGEAPRAITCDFAGGAFGGERLQLEAIAVEGRGWLSEIEMFWLRRWLAMPTELLPLPRSTRLQREPWLPLLYALQQLINAAALACVYGLLATGYTLVYAVIGQINLAFGEFSVLSAVAVVIGGALLATVGAGAAPLGLLAVFVLAAVTGMAAAWASHAIVFSRLRDAAPHVPLIAGIGLAILLQEGVRLLQGSDDLWLMPPTGMRFTIAGSGGFPVILSLTQLGLLGLTIVVYTILLKIIVGTRFGLSYRACAADRSTAALLGVDVEGTVARSFLLGGVLAGLAGFVIVEYYGVINFFAGLMLGFKAMAAAIVGGIGSVRGAMIGGIVVAALEVLWSAYFDLAAKDIAVFCLLTLILIFRPTGLVGPARI